MATGKRWTRRSTGEDAGGDTPFERGLACHRRSTQDNDTDAGGAGQGGGTGG